MVRRSVPVTRRLRAMRGQIVLAGVWTAAALTSGLLGYVQDGGGTALAMATVQIHPVLAPENGHVATIHVVPGQVVKPGDVLATIDVPGLAGELASAEAEVLAEQQLLQIDDGDRTRRFARDLDQMRNQLLSARVDLEAEKALLAGFEADLARRSAPGVAVSASELDLLKGQRDASKATVTAREAEIAQLERAERDARARLGGNLTGGSGELLAAEALRDSLRARMEATTLRAYTAGEIGLQVPAAGQWVVAGLPVVTVTTQATGEAVAYLDVRHAQRIVPGTTVQVHPESGSKLVATVSSVGASVELVPLRQQADPTIPEWGVPVTLQVAGVALTPGERLGVDF